MDSIKTMLGKILHNEIFKDEDISANDEKSIISITEPKNEGICMIAERSDSQNSFMSFGVDRAGD